MGEISFIVQTGRPGGYKQNQRQKQINSHVARYANSKRARELTNLKLSETIHNQQNHLRLTDNRTQLVVVGKNGVRRASQQYLGTNAEIVDVSGLVKLPRSPNISVLDQFGGSFVIPQSTGTDVLIYFWDWFISNPFDHDSELQLLCKDAWALMFSSVADESRLYAFLSTAAQFHSITTGDHSMGALASKFRYKSMQKLRQQLALTGFDGNNAASMLALVTASLSHGDFGAAATHLRHLKKLVQPSQDEFHFSLPGAEHIILWQDIQRASQTLTRPILDIKRWQRESGHGLWLPTSILLRNFLEDRSYVDTQAITNPRTLQLLNSAKKYGLLLGIMTETSAVVSNDNSLQLSTSLLLLNGHLLEHYLDLLPFEISASESAATLSGFAELQAAATTLATIFWLRVIVRDEAIMPVRESESISSVFNATHTILAALQRLLYASEDTAMHILTLHQIQHASRHSALSPQPSATIPPPLRLRLWLLYIGSFIEQRQQQSQYNSSRASASPAPVQYHQHELHKLKSALDLIDNPVVFELIIGDFLVIDHKTTLAPVWFAPVFRAIVLAHTQEKKILDSESWEVECLSEMRKMSNEAGIRGEKTDGWSATLTKIS